MIFTPGQPGWLEKLRRRPRAQAGLRARATRSATTRTRTSAAIPWRMDDEKVAYKGYEQMVKAGHQERLRPQGAVRAGRSRSSSRICAASPTSPTSARRRRTGRSSTSSSITRPTATSAAIRRWRWPSSSAPAASPGPATSPTSRRSTASATSMATSASCSRPRWSPSRNVCAALMGTLIKGLGADHVCWGTDAVWTGSPQWQIEGLRRLEIPEDMQKKHGFAPLGPADGPVKTAIFGGNNAKLYGIQPKRAMLELSRDRFAAMRTEYEKAGPEPSNLRYGYVVPNGPIDHSVFT